jgi:hypothetical protein
MSQVIGAGVTLEGAGIDDAYTFNLAAGATEANEGEPVCLDPSANNQAKLGVDGAPVLGMLLRVENRIAEGVLVGSVITEGGIRFKVLPADPLAVGDTAVCAGSGEIRKLVTGDGAVQAHLNYCVEVDTSTTPHTAVLLLK